MMKNFQTLAKAFGISVVLIVSGCAEVFPPLMTLDEMRSAPNIVKFSTRQPYSLTNFREMVFNYDTKCRNDWDFTFSPDGKLATWTQYYPTAPGNKPNPLFMIDVRQVTSTSIEATLYSRTNWQGAKIVQRRLEALLSKQVCD